MPFKSQIDKLAKTNFSRAPKSIDFDSEGAAREHSGGTLPVRCELFGM
jgi:hypothetical protein